MPQLPSLFRRPVEEDNLAGPISAFESETQALIQKIATPYGEHAVTLFIAGLIVFSVVTMAFVKLDRVVVSSGIIITTEGSIFVGPLDRAIIRTINVKSGDVVDKGQVLATLDPTFATADLRSLSEKMEGDEAQVQRLIAEREGKPYAPANSNPSQLLQASLWRQRQDEYQQNLNDLDARLNNARATLAGAEHDVKLYGERLDHAQAIEKMRTTLEKDGYGSKLNTLLATDSSTDIRRLQAEAQSLAQQTRHTIESLTAQRAVFIGKWRDDIETAMITVQSDLSQTRGELAKAQRIHDLITLEAPEDAVVLNIANASAGSVVGQDPQPLFTLVPLRGNLEAEVEIDAKDSGFILPGDTVRIKLDAYNFLRHGTIQGVIKTISEGTFTTGLNNESRSPYFKARIRITDTNLRSVPKSFRLVPGMTLAGDVLVGHRTMLSYLVEGGLKTGTEAMREP